MQMEETETDIGRFSRLLVIKQMFFSFFSFQSQETQGQHTEAMRCAEKTQDHIRR